MEMVFIVTLLLGIFFFMLYMPTVILTKKKVKKSDDYETLLVFVALSMLYVLLSYLFSNYYLLQSTEAVYECNVIASIRCYLHDFLSRVVEPTFHMYMIIFVHILVTFAYASFVAMNVEIYKEKIRKVLTIFLFFIVAVITTLSHYTILHDVSFHSGLRYISLFISNTYISLPIFYLAVLLYRNRSALK